MSRHRHPVAVTLIVALVAGTGCTSVLGVDALPSDTCGGATATSECEVCLTASCCSQLEACVNDSQCSQLFGCLDGCSEGDSSCTQSCDDSYSSAAIDDFDTCTQASCSSACGGGS